jgi:hypothetical protein
MAHSYPPYLGPVHPGFVPSACYDSRGHHSSMTAVSLFMGSWSPTLPEQMSRARPSSAAATTWQNGKPVSASSQLSTRKPNHILLMSVHNPSQPITTSVLSRLCSGISCLVRAVVLKKKRLDVVQAMLEFRGGIHQTQEKF